MSPSRVGIREVDMPKEKTKRAGEEHAKPMRGKKQGNGTKDTTAKENDTRKDGRKKDRIGKETKRKRSDGAEMELLEMEGAKGSQGGEETGLL